MATEKEFKLIGQFEDRITSKLKKLNREINTINKSFKKMQSRLRPIARDMGTIAMASERVTKALKNQRNGYQTNVNSMRTYRSEMGKTISAAKKLSNIKPPKPLPVPKFPKGAPPAYPTGMGGGGEKGMGFLGTTTSVALGGILTQAIVSGFRQGVALMMKPLRYFGNAFAERVGDEMADIQSAGGLFAVDRKENTGLFRGFNDALQMQERLNQSLAKSAAALPGATNDYVRTARQITDTVSIAFSRDKEAFAKLAQSLGGAEGASSEQQITKVLTAFTEKGVLLGQGQSGGIPLPILLEQLVSREQVNVQGLKNRYQALRDNPLLAGAIEDAQQTINATAAGSADRIGEVIKALNAALPQEVINKMRGSIEGLQEAFKSAFFDPDTGLFGLSRTLKLTTPKIDEFGRFLNENGEVVKEASEAARESTTLFKTLRETIAFFLVPLAELTDALPALFEPFEAIAAAFQDIREKGRQLSLNFNSFSNFFGERANDLAKLADTMADSDPNKKIAKAEAQVLLETKRQRGSLSAFATMLRSTGAITEKKYLEVMNSVKDFRTKVVDGEHVPLTSMTGITADILKGIMNSPLMQDISSAIGEALGATIDAIFTLLDKLINGVKGDTGVKVVDAFVKGFQKVITKERFDQIMKTFEKAMAMAFETIGSSLVKVGIPALLSAIKGALGGLAKSGPLGLAVVVGLAVKALYMFNNALNNAAMKLNNTPGARGRGGVQRFGRGGSLDRLSRMRRGRALGMAKDAGGLAYQLAGAPGAKTATKFTKAITGFTKTMTKAGRVIPGGALAMGAVDMGLAMASGEDFGQAAAGTIGAVLGGAAGTFFGPAGTVIGSMAGGAIADMAYEHLNPAAAQQREAAAMQLAAAKSVSEAQSLTRGLGVSEKEFDFGSVKEFTTRLDYAGFASNQNAQALIKEYQERNEAFETLKGLKTQYDKLKLALEESTVPQEAQARQLQTLNDKIKIASVDYEKEQKELVTKFAKTPRAIEDALVNTINTKLTFSQMDAAIAERIRRTAYVQRMSSRQDQKRRGGVKNLEPSYGGNLAPLLEEMRYKPVGSNLVMANSSETILNTGQTTLLANALKASGSSPTINVTVNATGDGNDIANQVASAVLDAIRSSENSTIA